MPDNFTLILMAIGLGLFFLFSLIISFVFFSRRHHKNKRWIILKKRQIGGAEEFPILKKIQKLQSQLKNNAEIIKELDSVKNEFDLSQRLRNELLYDLDHIEKLVLTKKIKRKEFKASCFDIERRQNNLLTNLEQIQTVLLSLSKTEDELRIKIQSLKEQFRHLKSLYSKNHHQFLFLSKQFDDKIAESEQAFSLLEEHLEEGQFDLAQQIIDQLSTYFVKLKEELEIFPDLIVATSVVESNLQQMDNLYMNMLAEKYALGNLVYTRLYDQCVSALQVVSRQLEKLEKEGVKEILANITNAIDLMMDNLKKEMEAKKSYDELCAPLYESVEEIEAKYAKILQSLNRIQKLYKLSSSQIKRLDQMQSSITILSTTKHDLELFINEKNKTPYTELVHKMTSLGEKAAKVEQLIEGFLNEVERGKNLVEEIYENIENMSVILNQLLFKIKNSKIVAFYERAKGRIEQVKSEIKQIFDLINIQPIDIELIDQLYTRIQNAISLLCNEYNKELLVLEHAEKAILFGNIYRFDFSEVERNFNKAENYLNNGDFATSVSIAAEVISRIHPEAYDSALRRKS